MFYAKFKKTDIERLYETAKEFIESKARIKMPAFEKFIYNDCTYHKYTSDMIHYDMSGSKWLIYKDNKKNISLVIDYYNDETVIQITKTYDDYDIMYTKKIDHY